MRPRCVSCNMVVLIYDLSGVYARWGIGLGRVYVSYASPRFPYAYPVYTAAISSGKPKISSSCGSGRLLLPDTAVRSATPRTGSSFPHIDTGTAQRLLNHWAQHTIHPRHGMHMRHTSFYVPPIRSDFIGVPLLSSLTEIALPLSHTQQNLQSRLEPKGMWASTPSPQGRCTCCRSQRASQALDSLAGARYLGQLCLLWLAQHWFYSGSRCERHGAGAPSHVHTSETRHGRKEPLDMRPPYVPPVILGHIYQLVCVRMPRCPARVVALPREVVPAGTTTSLWTSRDGQENETATPYCHTCSGAAHLPRAGA
ncbi:hypothetical protein B0H21DRAFT_561657 [Amylocystis lapponica]|nr:hypothetical protein B0H21DRAFT_561657 [Amylocystis lapponica]